MQCRPSKCNKYYYRPAPVYHTTACCPCLALLGSPREGDGQAVAGTHRVLVIEGGFRGDSDEQQPPFPEEPP